MDKNQREERRRQEDIALNRGLLWVGAAILMELLLMLVNKYYINYYSTVESINMVYAFDAGLKAVRIVALIALAASAVWCFLRFSREGAHRHHAPGPGGRFQRGDGHRPYHDLF